MTQAIAKKYALDVSRMAKEIAPVRIDIAADASGFMALRLKDAKDPNQNMGLACNLQTLLKKVGIKHVQLSVALPDEDDIHTRILVASDPRTAGKLTYLARIFKAEPVKPKI